MDRLSDLTRYRMALDAEHYELEQRQTAMAITVLKDLGVVATDPALLAIWLQGRRFAPGVALAIKAAVAAVDSSSGLAPSVPQVRAVLAAVDRRTVLGQLGAVRVPTTNSVGAVQSTQASAYWVGEQSAKPLSAMAFAATSLTPRKVAGQVAVASELLKVGTGDVLALLERGVVSAVAAAIDSALLDPSNSGTVNVKPASLTNGVTPTTAGADFADSVGKVLAAISGGAPTKPVLVVSVQTAVRLQSLRDVEAAGVRVILSPAAGAHVIAIDADGIAMVDDGGELRVGEPTIEMRDDPANPTIASTVLVSTFQRNLKVVRAERWISWAKRGDAVAYLTLA